MHYGVRQSYRDDSFSAKSICLEFPGTKRNRTSREREVLEAQCVVSY